MHTKNIRRPRVERRSPRVTDGQRHPVTVRAIPLALALAVLLLAPTPANAERIEAPDRTVDTVRVTYVEPIGRQRYVELNDGSTWRLRPCRYEDGRHCYWDAGTRGNGLGTSFVNVRGTVIHTWRI